jgi:hypothetical protein
VSLVSCSTPSFPNASDCPLVLLAVFGEEERPQGEVGGHPGSPFMHRLRGIRRRRGELEAEMVIPRSKCRPVLHLPKARQHSDGPGSSKSGWQMSSSAPLSPSASASCWLWLLIFGSQTRARATCRQPERQHRYCQVIDGQRHLCQEASESVSGRPFRP